LELLSGEVFFKFNKTKDPYNFRPRINKTDSIKDKEQKLSGHYFSMEE
jgi:translation initiation factor RLI1